METMETKKSQKVAHNFNCIFCHYITCKKGDYDKHLMTRKHHTNVNLETNGNNLSQKVANNEKYICTYCNKEYKNRSGLWKHKPSCTINKKEKNEKINETKNETKDSIILKLIKENSEMMSLLKEQQKQITDMIPKIGNTITNTNCNNKTFNLQFFLNEQCKNAINISEFVHSIDITIDDLKYTKVNGLIEGISNIMIRGLKELDIYKRPIHCTDLKRDTLYIKDDEKWSKDENNEKFKETIAELIEKEQEALNKWTDVHPDWDTKTHLQDEYVLMVNRLYQPVVDNEKKENKIIKTVSKEVFINK